MRYYYTYKITNLLDNKIYIGVHETDDLNDNYFGSGKLIVRAIKKHGIENFKKDILEFFDTREEMYNAESNLVTVDFCKDVNTYNISPGGLGGTILTNRKAFTGPHTEEAKKRISLGRKDYTHSEETRKKISENSWSRKNPEAQRAHAIAAGKSIKSGEIKKTEEYAEKISNSLKEYYSKNKSPNRGKVRPKITCPHCNKSGAKHVIYRWHFDNCKVIK